MVFLHPIQSIGQQKILNLVAAIIENQRTPIGMFTLAVALTESVNGSNFLELQSIDKDKDGARLEKAACLSAFSSL